MTLTRPRYYALRLMAKGQKHRCVSSSEPHKHQLTLADAVDGWASPTERRRLCNFATELGVNDRQRLLCGRRPESRGLRRRHGWPGPAGAHVDAATKSQRVPVPALEQFLRAVIQHRTAFPGAVLATWRAPGAPRAAVRTTPDGLYEPAGDGGRV